MRILRRQNDWLRGLGRAVDKTSEGEENQRTKEMADIRQKGRELRKEKGRIENRRALPSKITESKVELANKNRIFDFVVIYIFWGERGAFLSRGNISRESLMFTNKTKN